MKKTAFFLTANQKVIKNYLNELQKRLGYEKVSIFHEVSHGKNNKKID